VLEGLGADIDHLELDDAAVDSSAAASVAAAVVQRAAAQQLHDEIGALVRLRRLADVVDRADMRVIQRGRRARFALEAQDESFTAEKGR